MASEINGQKFVRKPGYLALEINNVADDGYNMATVTRLDDMGEEHTIKVYGYTDLDDVEDMIEPLPFPYERTNIHSLK